MNDFLKKLRSSHKKNPSDPKRNLDGHYYPQNERRKKQERRTNQPSRPNQPGKQAKQAKQAKLGSNDSLLSCLQDILPEFVDNTSNITHQLEKMTSNNTTLLESQIRKNNAMADFFENLNSLFDEAGSALIPAQSGKVTTSYASGTHYTKDEILDLIRRKRDEGATFSKIAAYLKGKSIPTFSARGEWHAQTIHRLCKEL